MFLEHLSENIGQYLSAEVWETHKLSNSNLGQVEDNEWLKMFRKNYVEGQGTWTSASNEELWTVLKQVLWKIGV